MGYSAGADTFVTLLKYPRARKRERERERERDDDDEQMT